MTNIKSLTNYFKNQSITIAEDLREYVFGNGINDALRKILAHNKISLAERVEDFLSSGLIENHDLKDFLKGKFSESKTYAYEDKIEESLKHISEYERHKTALLTEKTRLNKELDIITKRKIDPCEQNHYDSCRKNLNDELEIILNSIPKLDSEIFEQKKWLEAYNIAKTYPLVDVSFLGEITSHHTIPGKYFHSDRINVILPKFAAYNYFSTNPFILKPNTSFSYSVRDIKIETHSLLCKAYLPDNSNTKWSKNFVAVLNENSTYDREYCSYLDGFVPPQAKIEIERAKKIFNNDIYVIAEAKYEINFPTDKDPLVLGLTDRSAHFITSFDKTSIEEYIESVYVDGKGGKN